MEPTPDPAPVRRGANARSRRLLLLIAAIAVAPVVLSYLAYYYLPRDARNNYGTLLATQPLPSITGTRLDGAPFASADLRGRWVVLFVASGECGRRCAESLYASRQSRTIQNAERERVARLWLIPDDRSPPAGMLDEHADIVAARVSASAVAALPQGGERIYLIDPIGNYVLAWPSNPDIKAMARDIARLLRASRIG